MQCGRLAGKQMMLLMFRVMHQQIWLLFLLMVRNTVVASQLVAAAPSMADSRQPVALNNLLDLLRVWWMIVQAAGYALQLSEL